MSSLEEGLYDLGRLDQLAYQDTRVHRLDPRAKVVTTLVFLVCVVSFGKYDLLAMTPFVLYPVFTAADGNLPFDFLARKLLIAAPFAFFVGIFNPLFDTETVVQIRSHQHLGGLVVLRRDHVQVLPDHQCCAGAHRHDQLQRRMHGP